MNRHYHPFHISERAHACVPTPYNIHIQITKYILIASIQPVRGCCFTVECRVVIIFIVFVWQESSLSLIIIIITKSRSCWSQHWSNWVPTDRVYYYGHGCVLLPRAIIVTYIYCFPPPTTIWWSTMPIHSSTPIPSCYTQPLVDTLFCVYFIQSFFPLFIFLLPYIIFYYT